ncbi:MAG: tryptophan synthase subunit alpha, partial [Peptococcaceae bacterium]|nr:tryptophan synthase subunit alpha [Peptococcaceae bacterium]
MSRIAHAFQHGKAFIGFVTGGDPSLDKSEEYILALIRGGADLIEIGIPFSDPIAEGPVIQAANLRALSAGTTIESIFSLVARLRTQTDTPLVFLTYLNPVFRYGYAEFFSRCAEVGVDGVIIPDLPFEE